MYAIPIMRQIHVIIILSALVILISFGVLIYQQFPQEQQQSAYTDQHVYHRGEVIRSEDDFFPVTFGSATIWMDKNTEVELVDGRPSHERIRVLQGRVVTIGAIEIQTRETLLTSTGTTSYVHYSWIDIVDVAAIKGTTTLSINTDVTEISEGFAYKLLTLPPYNLEEISFSPEESTAKEFYHSVLQN